VVVGVKTRRDAKPEEFEAQRARLVEKALDERRSQLFDEFLIAARRKLEEQGRIETYPQTLAQLEESEPAALPQRPPIQLPPVSTK
jgi:hypothetical protein